MNLWGGRTEGARAAPGATALAGAARE